MGRGRETFMDTISDLYQEMNRLIEAARRQDIRLRAFGGLAIFAHSQDNMRFFRRDSPDVDFVVPREQRHKLESFFEAMGYVPDKQFNLLNGLRRQIYKQENSDRRIDILVGDFEMCHKLPLGDQRLEVDPVTIPLAELILSKAQIVQLNRKDALDILSLLLNNDLGKDSDGKIGLDRIAALCSKDWGLYKTVALNLEQVEKLLATDEFKLPAEERVLIVDRINQIRKAIDETPKSLSWQLRDKVGTRVRWYEEVEEVDR
jgi:hypothetical protein